MIEITTIDYDDRSKFGHNYSLTKNPAHRQAEHRGDYEVIIGEINPVVKRTIFYLGWVGVCGCSASGRGLRFPGVNFQRISEVYGDNQFLEKSPPREIFFAEEAAEKIIQTEIPAVASLFENLKTCFFQ